MKHSKKFIIIAVVTVVTLGGILGGVAAASADEEVLPPPVSANVTQLLDKIAVIYEEKTGETLDTQALLDAFKQAGQELRSEALDRYLDRLVENGRLTEEQAGEYKDWIEARPDVPMGPGLHFNGRFFGKIGRGFGGMFRGWCGPEAPDTTP